jgi:hypothetical protein
MLFITNLAFGQIKIDKAGNGWDLKIDSALQLIKEVDIEKFQLIIKNCFKDNYENITAQNKFSFYLPQLNKKQKE